MRLAAGFSFIVMLAVSAATAGETDAPTPNRILDELGFSEADQKAINAGEIVAIDLPTVLDNQLKGAVAMRVSATLDRAAAFFEGGRRLTVDATVTEFATLHPSIAENDWRGVGLGAGDDAEVARLLSGRPASVLNVSPEESTALKTALSGISADRPGVGAAAVSEAYRRVLAERYAAYLEGGLDGMPDYARGGVRRVSPAREIRADLTAAAFSILEPFPAFRQAVLDFPRNQPPGVSSTFYWIRTTVEGRPHYALAHEMTTRGDGYFLAYSRDFYSAHTYNTLQSTYLWLPDGPGVFAVHVNAGTTDEITGLFSGIAREVGKDRMKSDLIANFTEVRKQLTR